MTEKQEEILKAALELFSKYGYASTSTSKIANQAAVSEGLIFRHFKNKEGLLDAIAKMGEDKFKRIYSFLEEETNPIEILRAIITIPLMIPEEDYDFWRLQYKLKWEIKDYNQAHKSELRNSIVKAFKDLDYEKAEIEADLLLIYLEGVGSSILKGTVEKPKEVVDILLKKYYIV